MSLPSSYLQEIKALNREIIRSSPNDILQFCANFFNRRLETQRAALLSSKTRNRQTPRASSIMAGSTFPGRLGVGHNPFGGEVSSESSGQAAVMRGVKEEDENDTVTSPTTAHFGAGIFGDAKSGNYFGGDGFREGPPSASRSAFLDASEGFPSNYGMGRRVSVSAESLNPTASSNDNWSPPFHEKTPDQLKRLKKSISGNFLFSHLDDEQSAQILGALVEKPIPAKGIKVITQGDQGDFFYVVEKGRFDVFVNPSGELQPGPNGLGAKVATIEAGGSFGELALMYNARRAATVQSAEAGTLWSLDRVTFRRILMDSTFERRRMYESFLEEVPLLSSLTPYERSKIADALETHKFPERTVLIKEGDVGEAFFLLESGTADVFKKGVEGPVTHYKKGDYFGELALLNDAPRAASVISTSEVKVATLGKDGFQRLLGPVTTIMRRNDPRKESVSIDPLETKHLANN